MNKYLFFLLFPFFSFSQIFSGSVKDTFGNPLVNANVIAKPLQENKVLKFAIADQLGRYKLELEKGVPYEIRVSYLGFKEEILKTPVNFTEKVYDFKLLQTSQQIEEVIIKQEYQPIIEKKDTLIYDIKAFTTGNERKLKEQLEKLPGVEVDKNGGVTVQGKKVTKFFVENDLFFGGGTKLGVENIPANAVEKVEVIDKFNEVGFLKQVSDSEDLAMNIKLKKDKKKFVFGDLEAGAEVANDNGFYLAHAALFYYTPKTSISYIGDTNNIGRHTFTFSDMMRFQGGVSSFISERKELTNLYPYVTDNTNVVASKSQFSALNLHHEINNKIEIENFIIFSKIFTQSFTESAIQYLQNDIITNEERIQAKKNKNLLGIENFKLNYTPNSKEKWFYNGQIQTSTNQGNSLLTSNLNSEQNSFESIKKAQNFQLKQFVEWHKNRNKNNITTFVLNHRFDSQKPENTWLTDTAFLTGILPLQNDSFYQIQQINKVKNNFIDGLFKHYYTINSANQFNTIIGINYGTTSIQTSEKQILTNGLISDFAAGGFGNSVDYLLNDLYVGGEYKFKIGKWENKPAIYLHHYYLKTNQFTDLNKATYTLIEPSWLSEYEFSKSEKIKFNYKFTNDFPEANQFLSRFTLQNYNSIFKGNALLRNESFHNATLNYSKNNIFRGLTLFTNASFTKKTKTIRNEVLLNGINQYTTPIITDNPETNYFFTGNIEKKIYKFKLSLSTNFSWFHYIQKVNSLAVSNNRNNQDFEFRLRTVAKKWPSASVSYNKTYSQFSGLTRATQTSDQIGIDLNLNISKHFNFKTDYQVTYNKNSDNQNTNFNIANVYLSFEKKNSAFRFELTAQNILNNENKIENSFSDFMILNATTYILPRILMLSVSYKL